jgi:hypothetical protein
LKGGLDELDKLFHEAQEEVKPEYYKKWLAYCLGVMTSKMDETDIETMREGIKKYPERVD